MSNESKKIEKIEQAEAAELSEQELDKVAGGGATASGSTTAGKVTVTPSGGRQSTTSPQSQNTTLGV